MPNCLSDFMPNCFNLTQDIATLVCSSLRWNKMWLFHHSPSSRPTFGGYRRYSQNPSTIILSFAGPSCASSIATPLPPTSSLPTTNFSPLSNKMQFGRFVHHHYHMVVIPHTWTHLHVVSNVPTIFHEHNIFTINNLFVFKYIIIYTFIPLQCPNHTFDSFYIELAILLIRNHHIGNATKHTYVCNARPIHASHFFKCNGVQGPRQTSI